MDDFRGRVAVVTGAANGIGLALAHRFAAEGMKLMLADIDRQQLDAAVTGVRACGAEAEAHHVDVADPHAVEEFARAAFERFGAVHILCNNAGVLPPNRFRPVWEFPLEDWKSALDVNLMGVVHGLRSFVPRMLASGEHGHIVNTSSIGGLTSGAWSAPYGTTKHALMRITEALYAGLASIHADIGVTAFCPGLVRSQMAAGDEILSAEDAAGMVLQAIRARQLYLLTTDAYDAAIRERADCILARRNPVFPDIRDLNQRETASRSPS